MISDLAAVAVEGEAVRRVACGRVGVSGNTVRCRRGDRGLQITVRLGGFACQRVAFSCDRQGCAVSHRLEESVVDRDCLVVVAAQCEELIDSGGARAGIERHAFRDSEFELLGFRVIGCARAVDNKAFIVRADAVIFVVLEGHVALVALDVGDFRTAAHDFESFVIGCSVDFEVGVVREAGEDRFVDSDRFVFFVDRDSVFVDFGRVESDSVEVEGDARAFRRPFEFGCARCDDRVSALHQVAVSRRALFIVGAAVARVVCFPAGGFFCNRSQSVAVELKRVARGD